MGFRDLTKRNLKMQLARGHALDTKLHGKRLHISKRRAKQREKQKEKRQKVKESEVSFRNDGKSKQNWKVHAKMMKNTQQIYRLHASDRAQGQSNSLRGKSYPRYERQLTKRE